MHPSEKLLEILLVEDNPGDVLLAREALEKASVRHRMSHVADGVRALAFLRREGAFVHASRPDVVLLDLNLPRKDGRKVLAEMKADARLRAIPVIVLSSSSAEPDVRAATALQASAYLTKPVDAATLTATLEKVLPK